MRLRLSEAVRIAFPALWEPQAFGDGNPAWGGKLIIPPKSKLVKEIEGGMLKAAQEQPKWKGKEQRMFDMLVKKGDVCLRKDEYMNSSGDVYDGFQDMFYLSCRSEKTAPLVIDRDKSPLTARSGRPYSGCFVIASVDIWAQDNTYGKRINATLAGVQFFKDGDAFSGGAPASEDEFEDLSDGVDADDDDNDLT